MIENTNPCGCNQVLRWSSWRSLTCILYVIAETLILLSRSPSSVEVENKFHGIFKPVGLDPYQCNGRSGATSRSSRPVRAMIGSPHLRACGASLSEYRVDLSQPITGIAFDKSICGDFEAQYQVSYYSSPAVCILPYMSSRQFMAIRFLSTLNIPPCPCTAPTRRL